MKKNNDPHRRRFSIPTGKKERRFFHALTLRSRAERSLVSCGFAAFCEAKIIVEVGRLFYYFL